MADARPAARRLRDAAVRAAELLRSTTGARVALQALEQRVDLEALPPVTRRETERLLAHAEPLEALRWREAERVLKSAWGAPVKDVLAEIDPEPVALRPAAQVHRATLADGGAEVAVKVARPRLAQSLRGELGLVDAVAGVAGAVFPAIDAPALAREVRERLLDELDLEYAGGVQRSFHRALRRHPDLGVPAVHSELTGETVLVCDWVDGTPAHELDGEERERAARLFVHFHVGAAVFGTVHADPDPRDALLDAGGRLWILDFGATRAVAPQRVALAAGALDAFVADDARRLAAIVAEIGWLAEDDAHDGHAVARRIAGPLLQGPATVDPAAALAAAERMVPERDALFGLATSGRVAPEDLWPLRMLGGLAASLVTLGATADWPALAREALRDGW